MNHDFKWETMINYARQKDTWVNEIEVSQLIYKFDMQRLANINWIIKPKLDRMQRVCQKIAREIIEGGKNSLISENLVDNS